MSTFPGSPRMAKGGLVLLDAESGAIHRIITLQYNPDTLTRTLAVKATGSESGDRSEALRLTGPPTETIKLEAEIDATPMLEFPEQNRSTAEFGISPQLALLESIVYPSSNQLIENNRLAEGGVLEIAPMEAPLILFIWSQSRIVPVRITEFSITEEAFDPALNPLRAKVSLGMRVLNVNDLGFKHKGSAIFMAYLHQKEKLATMIGPDSLQTLGIGGTL